MSNDPLKIDPLTKAGIVLSDLSAEELQDAYNKSGAKDALEKHLESLETCRVNPDSLWNVIVGPGVED